MIVFFFYMNNPVADSFKILLSAVPGFNIFACRVYAVTHHKCNRDAGKSALASAGSRDIFQYDQQQQTRTPQPSNTAAELMSIAAIFAPMAWSPSWASPSTQKTMLCFPLFGTPHFGSCDRLACRPVSMLASWSISPWACCLHRVFGGTT